MWMSAKTTTYHYLDHCTNVQNDENRGLPNEQNLSIFHNELKIEKLDATGSSALATPRHRSNLAMKATVDG